MQSDPSRVQVVTSRLDQIGKGKGFNKEKARTIRPKLEGGPDKPIESLTNPELVAVIKDNYILSKIKGIRLPPVRDIRRLYKTNRAIKNWMDWVVHARKFVETY